MPINTLVTTWSARDGDPFAYALPDLVLPREVQISVEDEPELDMDLTIDVEYDDKLQRYVARRVEARARDGQEIRGANLRAVRVQQYVQEGLNGAVTVSRKDGRELEFPIAEDLARELIAAGPSNQRTMLYVARIYRMAEIMNLPPAREIQTQLHLTAPTASVWIRRARDRGLLPQPGEGDGTLSHPGLDRG
jgi:hypothetical protein